MSYFISRIIYKVILALFFKLEVAGRENIPRKGPFIMVANHMSYADPAVMGVACNTMPVSFLAKKELSEIPFLGAWCKSVGCIFVERDYGRSEPLKKALKALKDGKVLGIFPEGTRSPDGNLQKAKPGIGVIVAKSKVPVIPMYVSGTARVLPRGKKIPRPSKIRARIGKPVDMSGSYDIGKKRELYEFIGDRIMSAISSVRYE